MSPTERLSSEAMHYFLMSQLNYSQGYYDKSKKNLLEVKALIEGDSYISSKLAELHLREGDLDEALAESSLALKLEPKNLNLALLHAGVLEAADRLVEAEELYRALLKSHPQSEEVYVFLANLYERQDKNEECMDILRSFKAITSRQDLALLLLGKAAERQGKLEEAEKYLRDSYLLDKSRETTFQDLCRILIKQGKIDEASELAREILKGDETNELALRILSHLLFAQKKYDQALPELKILAQIERDSEDSLLKISFIYLEKQDYTSMIAALSELLDRYPNNMAGHYYLGMAYGHLKEFSTAQESLNRVKAQDNLFSSSRLLSAFLYREAGDVPSAIRALEKALEAEPENREIMIRLISFLRLQGDYKKASGVIEPYFKNHSADQEIAFLYGALLYDLKQPDKSEKVMNSILEHNPDHADALNFIAYSMAERSLRLDDALEMIGRALKVEPENGYYLDTLGWVYYQKGLYQQAVEVLEKAVGYVNDDIVILSHYGKALFRTNQIERAADVFRSVVEKSKKQDTPLSDEEKESIEQAKKFLLAIYSQP